jgi:peptidoglycan/LPS O-acetylase OafA/YrhL
MKTPAARHPGLELLRGLAALAVCLGHVRAFLLPPLRSGDYAWWEQGLYFLSAQGEAAVWIFLVLSGYLVGGSVLQRRAAGTWSWSGYLLRRGTRLWVVLVPALLLTFLCDTWRGSAPVVSAGAMATDTVLHRDGLTLLGNLCFLQDLVVAPYGSNTPLWSLAYEAWFYVLFPAALMVVADAGWGRRAFASLFVLGGLWLLGPRGWWLAMPWLVGAALARWEQHHPGRGGVCPRLLPWAGVAAVLVLAPFLGEGLRPWVFPCVALATGVLVWSEAARSELRGAACARLGAISYTLYASHMPLAVLLTAALAGPVMHVPGATRWLVVFAATGALVAFAWALWWAFERRTEAIRAALFRLRPSPR